MSKDLIKITRGMDADMNLLQENEPGYAADTKKLYIGTGNGEPILIGGKGDKGDKGDTGANGKDGRDGITVVEGSPEIVDIFITEVGDSGTAGERILNLTSDITPGKSESVFYRIRLSDQVKDKIEKSIEENEYWLWDGDVYKLRFNNGDYIRFTDNHASSYDEEFGGSLELKIQRLMNGDTYLNYNSNAEGYEEVKVETLNNIYRYVDYRAAQLKAVIGS